MKKDRPPPGAAAQSWFSRLSKWLTRAPADNAQLQAALHDAQMNDLFDADALAMIEGVLQVDDMQVRDIMIPRIQVVMLERDASRDVLIRTIVESGHSRFPVIGDSRDEVVGILLAIPAAAVIGVGARFGTSRYLASGIYSRQDSGPDEPDGQ